MPAEPGKTAATPSLRTHAVNDGTTCSAGSAACWGHAGRAASVRWPDRGTATRCATARRSCQDSTGVEAPGTGAPEAVVVHGPGMPVEQHAHAFRDMARAAHCRGAEQARADPSPGEITPPSSGGPSRARSPRCAWVVREPDSLSRADGLGGPTVLAGRVALGAVTAASRLLRWRGAWAQRGWRWRGAWAQAAGVGAALGPGAAGYQLAGAGARRGDRGGRVA